MRPCREESVDFDKTKNVYIEGDNLEALKLLRETYLGKVKMIYIDPPYNTGNDFVYDDNFSMATADFDRASGIVDQHGNRLIKNPNNDGKFHTNWLNMIYPRLLLARDFLSEDGFIFISIDDCEVSNLKKICDEIFNSRNFIANIVWQSTAGSNTGTMIVTVTENILIYGKDASKSKLCGQECDSTKYNLKDQYLEVRGPYALDKLDSRRVGVHYSEALNYPISMPDGTQRYPGGFSEKSSEGWNYLWSNNKVLWGIDQGFIVFKKSEDGWNVYNKRYLNVDNEGKSISRTVPFRNIILSNQFNTSKGTSELRELFGFRPFDYPKPSALIEYLMSMVVRNDNDAIVMDFFSGSASTAEALLRTNIKNPGRRSFVLVQLPEFISEESESCALGFDTICDIGKERIRRAGKKILEENPSAKDLDVGFRVFKIDSSNMRDVFYDPQSTTKELIDYGKNIDTIKDDRSAQDLLIQVMLELGIELSAKIEEEEICGKTVFTVDDGYLMACFDSGVSDDVVETMAKRQPRYAVLADRSMANDSVAINFGEIFKTYSPNTQTRIL